jgi:GDP-D-mannose dehydratase
MILIWSQDGSYLAELLLEKEYEVMLIKHVVIMFAEQ